VSYGVCGSLTQEGVLSTAGRTLVTSKAVYWGWGSGCSEAVCERALGGGEMATGSVTGSHASGTCKRGEEKSDTKASYKGTDPTTAGRKANL
jgi:hypothetical protein